MASKNKKPTLLTAEQRDIARLYEAAFNVLAYADIFSPQVISSVLAMLHKQASMDKGREWHWKNLAGIIHVLAKDAGTTGIVNPFVDS